MRVTLLTGRDNFTPHKQATRKHHGPRLTAVRPSSASITTVLIDWTEIDADNIALTSSTTSQIQQKARSHRTNSKGTGLKINSQKTRLLRLNTPNIEKVHVVGQDTEGVESFVCQQDRLYGR